MWAMALQCVCRTTVGVDAGQPKGARPVPARCQPLADIIMPQLGREPAERWGMTLFVAGSRTLAEPSSRRHELSPMLLTRRAPQRSQWLRHP